MQSRRGSLVETICNTFIGWFISLVSQLLVFPLFNIHIPFSSNLGISAWFTLISIARGYVIRRTFNRWIQRRFARV